MTSRTCAGKVNGLSLVNIAGKVMWAAIVLPVLVLRLSIVWLAAAFALSETFKAICSIALARAHTGLKLTVDLRAALRAMKASMPFWVP